MSDGTARGDLSGLRFIDSADVGLLLVLQKSLSIGQTYGSDLCQLQSLQGAGDAAPGRFFKHATLVRGKRGH